MFPTLFLIFNFSRIWRRIYNFFEHSKYVLLQLNPQYDFSVTNWYFCLMLQDNCQNYVRILTKNSKGQLMVCGTNSFKPVCRDYNINPGNYSVANEKPGQALCPYDPHHNSTAIYVGKNRTTQTFVRPFVLSHFTPNPSSAKHSADSHFRSILRTLDVMYNNYAWVLYNLANIN